MTRKSSSIYTLKTRWGGRAGMPRFFSLFLFLFLFVLMAGAAFAQDPAPTTEVVVPPESSVPIPASSVDTVIVIALMALFAVIALGGMALIGYLSRRLGNSVDTEQAEKLLKAAQDAVFRQLWERVQHTPETWDDALLKTGIELFNYKPGTPAPVKPTPPPATVPPVTNPTPQPLPLPEVDITQHIPDVITKIGFADAFGIMGDKRTWSKVGNPDKVIEIPQGYTYIPTYKNGAGLDYPAIAVETNATYGTRLNIAWTAGIHKFARLGTVNVPQGRSIVTLDYESEINADAQGSPYHNWLWIKAYINGKEIASAKNSSANHIPAQNGMQQAKWIYDSDNVQEVDIAFEISIHWASAGDNSRVDLKSFQLSA